MHVWRADLAPVSDDELLATLSFDERGRAGSFLSLRKGQLWARSRGVLRSLMGRYLETGPRDFRLVRGRHGKPALLASVRRSDRSPLTETSSELHFNLSHSGELALYAFTRVAPVGVDIEVMRRPINEVAIVARVLGAATAARLIGLAPLARRQEFLQAWSRYEATLKCRGVGLGTRRRTEARDAAWVAELDLGSHAVGAVAVAGTPAEVRQWTWWHDSSRAAHGA